VHKGFLHLKQENEKDTIKSAACGRSINVAVMSSGKCYMWGKGEYHKVRFGDLIKYSIPY
jgi:alpha-tubulin suppressor-like RCC1 family protein